MIMCDLRAIICVASAFTHPRASLSRELSAAMALYCHHNLAIAGEKDYFFAFLRNKVDIIIGE